MMTPMIANRKKVPSPSAFSSVGTYSASSPLTNQPKNTAMPIARPRISSGKISASHTQMAMLLAPMTFEDQVLGVLVLSKLGLHQFSDDDLRLLVIYASFAAQAFANADATEKLRAQSETLERQLVNNPGRLQVTESILTPLDPNAILDQV